MSSLADLMGKINRDNKVAESKLKEICSQSSRLKYDDLIERLHEITEHQMPINYYKFTSFIDWLADDLKFNWTVNEDSWDMSIEEIDEKFNNNEYWQNLYAECSEGKGDLYKSPEDLKVIMLDWMYTHCIDSAIYGLQREYKERKSKGMI